MQTISMTRARRGFRRLLRQIQKGSVITVTCRGVPVVRLEPPQDARKASARRALLERLAGQPALNIAWNRGDLYDD